MEYVNIYNREGNSINIYRMIPKYELIKEYKKSEEKRIIEKERVYVAKTSLFKILEENEVDEDKLNTSIEGLRLGRSSYYHTFKPLVYNDDCERLLSDYYNGLFDDCRVVQVLRKYGSFRNKIVKYLVMTVNNYQNGEISNIISIPETLYFLQMIFQGKFHLIYRDDIDRQLSYFELSKDPINNLSVFDLEEWHKTLNTSEPFDNILENIDIMSKIYKRIKK